VRRTKNNTQRFIPILSFGMKAEATRAMSSKAFLYALKRHARNDFFDFEKDVLTLDMRSMRSLFIKRHSSGISDGKLTTPSSSIIFLEQRAKLVNVSEANVYPQ
jgi:hypothetical protein